MTTRHTSSSSGTPSHDRDGLSDPPGFGRACEPLLPGLPGAQRPGGDRAQGRALPLLVVRGVFVSLVLGRCRRRLPGLCLPVRGRGCPRRGRGRRSCRHATRSYRLGPAADGCTAIDRRRGSRRRRRGAGRHPRRRDPDDRWRRGGDLRAVRRRGADRSPLVGAFGVGQRDRHPRGVGRTDDCGVRACAVEPDPAGPKRWPAADAHLHPDSEPRSDFATDRGSDTAPDSCANPDAAPDSDPTQPHADPQADPQADTDLPDGAFTRRQARRRCPSRLDDGRVHGDVHAAEWSRRQDREDAEPDAGLVPSGEYGHRRDDHLSPRLKLPSSARDQLAGLISRSNAYPRGSVTPAPGSSKSGPGSALRIERQCR